MASRHTEFIIEEFRHSAYKNVNTTSGTLARALIEVADQRDELMAACEALIAYRDKVGPLSFQLEKADDYIRMMRLALEKARGPDGD